MVEFDVHYVNKDPEEWFGRKDEIVQNKCKILFVVFERDFLPARI